MKSFQYCYIVALIAMIIGCIYYVILFFITQKNTLKKETNIKKHPHICVLIPARNESKVIESLLVSIEKQTVKIKPEDVYIIVESKSDRSIDIANKHHMNVFIRKKLNLKTKGYALKEMIEELCHKQIYYDLYFIMDADNVMTRTFIEHMLVDYQQGYAVSTGYRNLKNKEHYFPVSAGLTFYMINYVRNKYALTTNGNLLLSGTGYYIHGDYIKKWGTFPFHSLTEDYEASLYFALHGVSTTYQENAIFYDEQPTTYQSSIIQRSRWIKGYLVNWLKYRPYFQRKLKEHPNNPGSLIMLNAGIIPALWLIGGLVILIITSIIYMITHFAMKYILDTFLLLGLIYFALFLFTWGLLIIANRELHLSKKVYIETLFYHPIFLVSFIHAYLVAAFKKNLGWESITHEYDEKQLTDE